jgi:hypothetical protein
MLRDPADTLEGDGILAESPGNLGLLLWHTSRDVTLWGQTPLSARGNLFAEGSADRRAARLDAAPVPRQIGAAINTIHGMLALGSRADAGDLSVSCLEIAAWACGAGLPRTAVAFAQAAAVVEPAFGAAALQTGIYAVGAGQHVRGETWLRRAIDLSRRERDRAALASAAVELAAFAEAQGRSARAELWYIRAFRTARRFGVSDVRVRAVYGLFRLARARMMVRSTVAQRTPPEREAAIRYARAAQALQSAGTAANTGMLLDLAMFWRLVGDPRRELTAIRRLHALWEDLPPAHQLRAAAMVARARADLENTRRGAKAARIAWELMESPEIPDEVRVLAALDLAHASARMGKLAAFTQAKRIVLRLAPAPDFLEMVSELDALWPAPAVRERAS